MSTVSTKQPRNTVLTGVGIASGVAIGKAFLYRDIFDAEQVVVSIEPHEVDDQYARIEQAIAEVHEDLTLCADRIEQELVRDLADIFRAHQLILHDPQLKKEIKERLDEDRVNAEHVIRCVLKEWEDRFLAMKDASMRRRSADVADLGQRLLRKLAGVRGHSLELMPEGSVLVTTRLLPSEAVFLSRQSVKAAIVEIGGPTSHCALLTRGMGIPAVAQIGGLFERISTGDRVIVDGNRGCVTLFPDDTALAHAREETKSYSLSLAKAQKSAHAPAVTQDGVHIPVMANVACREEAQRAAERGADGIGLYRIEAFYLGCGALPSDDELHHELSGVFSHFEGKPICVRLLDVGGDKSLPYLRLPVEDNPFLGRRGVRLLLAYPELLVAQFRVLLALSTDHDLRLLVPMVTLVSDFRPVREILVSLANELGITPPPLGAMIETPAAAFSAAEIAKYADFISVGTNDLAQYALAADRGNPLVSRYYMDDHRSVIQMLAMISAKVRPMPVAVCGELGSREHAIPSLLDAGIRILSVAAPLVPMVKQAVRNTRAEQ